MISGKRVLALIPARGGSKVIKGKNIIDLCGKPLIAYSIDAAKESAYVDRIVVTTDSEQIQKVSADCGAYVPFLRPQELASDTAKTIDAVLHAVNWLKERGDNYDILLLLQPTQPLRRAQDIDAALNLFVESGERGVVSVRPVEEHPILMRTMDGGEMEHVLPLGSTVRRQDMPEYVLVDGSIYINRIADLSEKTSFNDNPVPYCMEKQYSVDIDEWTDLELAKWYLQKNAQTTK